MAIYRGSGGSTSTTDQATIDQVAEDAATATTKAAEAATSASSASSSASSASSSASTATTKASEASTSATSAANSASSASGYAAGASTAAGNSAGFASDASTSATNAAASAAAALSSKASALDAQTAAETAESNASDHADDAVKAAYGAEDVLQTLSDSSTLYSARHYAAKAAASSSGIDVSVTAAAASATAAAASETAAASSESAADTSANAAATSATAAASSATSASGSATTATTKASEAATSATAAAASETAAAASETAAAASETAAAASESAAASSETAAGLSATAAGNSAISAGLSATNAGNSASSASTSATTATTQASNASTSATNAAASETAAAASETAAAASETAAAGSASTASTQATNAATSATSAASSASTATTKASEASTSATNAASSASSAASSASAASASKDAALAALDSFDDRYLGQKTSDPTVDNDGDALIAGALYFNTTDDVMKVYEGSTWVAAYASLSGALLQANNLSDVQSATAARTNLGVAIGTDVQAYSSVLAGTTASYTTAEETKLAGIETAATADQTAQEIATAIDADATAEATLKSALGLGTAAYTASTAYATAAQGALADSATQPADNISTLTNDSGYITGVSVSGISDTTITTPADNEVSAYDSTTSKWINQTPAEAGLQPAGSYLTGNQTITLSGDATGSGTTSIVVTVADDSHNHVISNVDGLQTALDGKQPLTTVLTNTTASYTTAEETKLAGIETGATADQSITAGSGLTGGGTGDVTLNVGAGTGVSVAADSISVNYGTTAGTACQGNDSRLSNSRTCNNSFDNPATARTNLGLGSLATLSAVGAAQITDNTVGAAELNVSGNGTTSQFLRSDGDGTFTWATPTDTNTTYSAGTGLDLSGTTFSIESDLRDITYCGNTGGEYFHYDNTNALIRGYINSAEKMRLYSNGTCHFDGDVIAYSTTISDERLKENIVGIDDAVNKVSQLNGYTFTYKHDDKVSAGVIAQEVEKVLPQAVYEAELGLHTNDDGELYKLVNYDALHGLLIEAVKELTKRVEELENK